MLCATENHNLFASELFLSMYATLGTPRHQVFATSDRSELLAQKSKNLISRLVIEYAAIINFIYCDIRHAFWKVVAVVNLKTFERFQVFAGICMRAMLTLPIAIALMALLSVPPAQAKVNLKNGNYYVSYTDMIIGVPEFEIARTYNSKATQTLSFGFGWGTDIDTSLTVAGDGSVVVMENGSGATRRYNPPSLRPEERRQVVETMLDAMEGAGWLSSDAQLRETRTRLNEDSALLRQLHRRLVDADLVPARDVAIGERLTSSQTPNVFLVREPGGYYRRGTGAYERFNLKGQLVELVNQDGSGYRLRRSVQGHLREIIVANGTHIAVATNAGGQIIRLTTGDLVATYEYDDNNNLVRAVNVVGGVFAYEYDAKHNMRFIRYSDDTFLEVGYDEGTQFATFLRQRDGQFTSYDYGKYEITEPDIIDHYYTRFRAYDAEGAQSPNRDYTIAYRVGRDRFGNTYTAGIKQTDNGVSSETRYSPCGNPSLIERGNSRTEFDYDDDCRLIYKKTDSKEIRLDYERRNGKISRVETRDLRNDTQKVVDFTYNLRGNLVTAKDSGGRSAMLKYNDDNQIVRMRNHDEEVLTFEYGVLGKPTLIEIEGVGSIDVVYDDNGEIENVASEQGHEMALRVTQAFQGLLALVKPAGVNFD